MVQFLMALDFYIDGSTKSSEETRQDTKHLFNAVFLVVEDESRSSLIFWIFGKGGSSAYGPSYSIPLIVFNCG